MQKPLQERIYALDLLRSVAILSVIAFHFPRPESAMIFRALSHFGFWGVDLFFILSGFLIGGQWFRSMNKNEGHIKTFYLRRFIRTLPSYYAYLGVAALFGLFSNYPIPDWRTLFFVQNTTEMTSYAHTWSLCVEEHFYLIFPLLGLLIWRKPKWVAPVFTACLLIPLALRTAMWFWLRPDHTMATQLEKTYADFHTYIYYQTPMRFDALTIGVALAYLQVMKTDIWNRWMQQSHRWLATGLMLIAFAAGICLNRLSFLGITLSFTFVALGCAALLVSSLGANSLLTRIRLPGVSKIALLSYTLYLTHLDALGAAGKFTQWLGLSPYSALTIATEIAFIALMSFVLHFMIEKPFLNWRDRIMKGSQKVATPSIDQSRKVG